MAESPNPERRSDSALLCLCAGFGLLGASWFLGVGGVMAAAFSGGDPMAIAGSIAALIGLGLLGIGGAILALIGSIWLVIRVIADSREADSKERYARDVER